MVQKSCTSWCGKYGIIYKVLFIFIYIYMYICQVSTSISFLLPFREDELEQGNCWNDVFPIEDGDSEIMFRKDHSVLSLISHSRKLPWTSHGPQTWMVKFAQECSSELWDFSVSISQMLHGDIPDLPGWMFFSFMAAFHSSPHPAHMGMLDLTFCQTTLEFLGSTFCWWFRNPAITTWDGAKTL